MANWIASGDSFFSFANGNFFAKSNFARIEQRGSPSFMMMNQEQDFTITSVTAHSTILTTFLHMYVLHSTYGVHTVPLLLTLFM